MVGPHIPLEGVKKININESGTIEPGFPVVKSLLIKLHILKQGSVFTSFVTLTVILSETVMSLSG